MNGQLLREINERDSKFDEGEGGEEAGGAGRMKIEEKEEGDK